MTKRKPTKRAAMSRNRTQNPRYKYHVYSLTNGILLSIPPPN
jgi:hypothetical protein